MFFRIRNQKCTIFHDQRSGLKITATHVKGAFVSQIVEYKGKKTPRIIEALKAGAIEEATDISDKQQIDDLLKKGPNKVEVPESLKPKDKAKKKKAKEEEEEETEEEETKEEETEEEEEKEDDETGKPLEQMSLTELQKFYETEYEVTAKDIKKFNKLDQAAALAYLKKLEKE